MNRYFLQLSSICAFATLSLLANGSSQAGTGFVPPTPFPIPLSAAGPDQLQSAVAGPNGSFYAAGFVAQSVGGPLNVVVVKITAAGTLDPSFGLQGVASTGLVFAGGNDEIDIALQNGQPIVSATVANNVNPLDRDVALVRLAISGVVDPSFGDANGVRILSLNTAIDSGGGMLVGRDAARALAVANDGSIYLHAVQRGEGDSTGGGPRTDTDFVLVKFTPNGAVDTNWSDGDGKLTLDIQESNATARAMLVLDDGSVIGSGYANSPGLGSVQPVLYKLTPSGMLDPTFAQGGLFHDTVLAIQTEIFGIALHGDNIVTGGYGRNSGDVNLYVSMRFSASTGVRDLNWGGAPNGAVLADPSGALMPNNCRNAVALPDGRTAMIGSTGPGNMPSQDAAYVMLKADGTLDTTFGTGMATFVFGANGNDQFWGGAYNDGQALFVGYKGGGMSQTAVNNDDAYAVLLTIPDDTIFRNGFQVL